MGRIPKHKKPEIPKNSFERKEMETLKQKMINFVEDKIKTPRTENQALDLLDEQDSDLSTIYEEDKSFLLSLFEGIELTSVERKLQREINSIECEEEEKDYIDEAWLEEED